MIQAVDKKGESTTEGEGEEEEGALHRRQLIVVVLLGIHGIGVITTPVIEFFY